jgi:hypothetical protein
LIEPKQIFSGGNNDMNWSLNWLNENDFQYSESSEQEKYELTGKKEQGIWNCELRSFQQGTPSLMTAETEIASFISESPEQAVKTATELLSQRGK